MRAIPARVTLLVAILAVAGCTSTSTGTQGDGGGASPGAGVSIVAVAGSGSFERLEPEVFATAIAAGDGTVINVHIPYEGEIEGTDSFIPFDTIGDRLDGLGSPDEPVYLYCRTGRMSTIAAETLVRAGFTDVRELAGGMDAWTEAGRSLIQGTGG